MGDLVVQIPLLAKFLSARVALADHAGHSPGHKASDPASVNIVVRLADDLVGVEAIGILRQVEKAHYFTRHIDAAFAVGVFVIVLPFLEGFRVTDWHWLVPFVWVCGCGCVSGRVSTPKT